MEGTPNTFAWIALAVSPFAIVAVYAALGREARLARTTAWIMLLSAMFLPSGVRLKTPGVPFLDKHRLTFLAIAVGLYLFHPGKLLRVAPARWFPRAVLAVMIFGIWQTVRTNGDVLTFGPTQLPGLKPYDIASLAAGVFLDVYLPFTIGQRVFQRTADVVDLLEVMSLCGLVYAPFCLLEVRLSPQFHRWVYGTHPSSFLQQIRYGGFRPVVFMNHGLTVAMFLLSCFCASLGLRKARAGAGAPVPAGVRAAVDGALLLLCKSLGAALYGVVAFGAMSLRRAKALRWGIVLVALLVVLYPAMRYTHRFPRDWLVAQFGAISAERAESLDVRFFNEDMLLARAAERPWFGWGSFGRNRIHSSWGQDVSITDGEWIIWLGSFGVVGAVAFFSLVLVPPVRFARHSPAMPPREAWVVGTLAVIVTAFAVDLIPNSLSDFLPLAYAGALFTVSERCAHGARAGRLRARARRAGAPEPAVAGRAG